MSLFEIDRYIVEWINHNRIKPFDNFFIFITDTAYVAAILTAFGILLFSLVKKINALKQKALQMGAALLLNTAIINILKYSINRQRPFVNDALIEKLSGGGSPSFPSGHTADAFLMAMSLTLLFGYKKVLLFFVWIWAFTVAYTRIALGVHYPSDVLASILIGIINALIVHKIFKNRRLKADDRTLIVNKDLEKK